MQIMSNTELEVAAPVAGKQNQGNTEENNTPKKNVLETLASHSVNRNITKLRKQAKNATFIAGRMALAGQITVFYASPNTGKTLLTLKLISEAKAASNIKKYIFHINLDDTFDGMLDKAEIGERHGFFVLGPDKITRPNEQFEEIVDKLIEDGLAKDAVFILDTLKKFVDIMHKNQSSKFMTICRKLTAEGGTIIALAHTNKKNNNDSPSIPAGTTDVLEDCDCSYVLDVVNEEETKNGLVRTIEFTNKKIRGNNVRKSVYSYTQNPDGDYKKVFDSVNQLDPDQADEIRMKKSLQAELALDNALIEDIKDLLVNHNTLNHGEITEHLKSSSHSRRAINDCLKRWCCNADQGGQWKITKGPNNSSNYELL